MKTITITAMIKDGGYESLKITPEMLGDLAYTIQEYGCQAVHLANNRSLIVEGIVLFGKNCGDRIITKMSEV
jgi:hypothetical protein